MASRCISTLNDLDKISDRIYYKHSKGKFRAGIEAKLKVSREKAERSLRDIDKESSCSYKMTPSHRSSVRTSSSVVSSRCFSMSATDFPNKGGKHKTLEHSTTKSVIKGQERDKIQRRKTKSCPSCTLSSKTSSNTDEKSAGHKTDIPRTASIFGKYNGKDSEYKPTAWFNLPQETSIGVIDSFECEAKNMTPLCYSVNVKRGESVPNLLRHNLEVRVGQNGVVRTEKNGQKVPELGDDNSKQGKKRTAPLNWEEQLNWQNACIISAGVQTDDDLSSKSLCETHPVIFHKRKTERGKDSICKRIEEKIHSPAYKLSLETRWVYPDRRNLLSTRDTCKCITAVEVEDARFEDVISADSKPSSQHGVSVTAKAHAPNVEEKVLKKVSFEDEEASSENVVGIIEAKHRENKEERKFNELTSVTDESNKLDCGSVRNIRPKTSRERTRTNEDELTTDVRKLRRPQTAPPGPPPTPRLQASNCIPIKIPTSEADMESNSFANSPENQTSEEKLTFLARSESVTPEEAEWSLTENEEFPAFSIEISAGSTRDKIAVQDGCPPKRVSFKNGPRSAPVSRTSTPHQEAMIPRANSSTAFQRRPNKSPSPVVIVSESSLELPKDLPPAQALVALRKKIREDLVQQNRDLQLDIQQLYLRKHSE